MDTLLKWYLCATLTKHNQYHTMTQTRTDNPDKPPRIDFDGNWKEIIPEFFEEFVAFFLPELHPLIDFARPPEFLEQELRNILDSIGPQKRVTDKLVKVWLKDGTEQWILIHIEVQARFESDFSDRMYLLFSMIFAKHRTRIASLVVYTTQKVPKRFNFFESKLPGTHLRFDFTAYKVRDQKEDLLIADKNIFALFVLANLYVIQTKGKKAETQRARLELKKKIVELAMARQMNLEKLGRFLIFVDGIMLLPSDLMDEFQNYFSKTYNIMSNRKLDIAQSQKNVANIFMGIAYGDTYENLIAKERAEKLKAIQQERAEKEKERTKRMKERAEKERERAEKEKEKAEKERERAEKEKIEKEMHARTAQAVFKLCVEKGWSPLETAEVLNLDIAEVEKIIAEHAQKP